MAHNWDQYTWRLVFRDDFSTYNTQDDYEAAYPESLFGFPVTTYSEFGPTNGPQGTRGLTGSTDANDTRLGTGAWASGLVPARRVFKFIAHVDNDWQTIRTVLGATLIQPYSTHSGGFNGLFQVENSFNHLNGANPNNADNTLLITNIGNASPQVSDWAVDVMPHTPTSTKRVDVRIVYSTSTEIEPGVFEPNEDGILEAFVNDVLVIEYTGVMWNNNEEDQSEPYWDAVFFQTLGRASLFEAWDTIESERTPPTVEPPEECPCPPPDGGHAPTPSPGSPSGGTPPPSSPGAIGGGGFGNSGITLGGEGSVNQCEFGGTVGEWPRADPGESMDGVTEDRVWVEIAFKEFTPTNDATDIPEYWAIDQTMPDKPDYYGGRKAGRGLGLGRITRGMNDENGSYAGQSWTIALNDKDRAALRARLGNVDQHHVWEREGIARIASETNRRTGYATPPKILARGVTRDISLGSGFTGSITFEDPITTQFGKFGPDRMFPSRLLTNRILPGIPRELDGKPQQYIFGEVSDEGATDLVTGEPAAKGLIPIWAVSTMGAEHEYHYSANETTVIALYGSDGETPPGRRLLTEGSDYRVQVVDLTDSETGDVHRCTHIFCPSDSIHSTDHIAGRLNMAANGCGQRGMNGLVITDAFKIAQWIFEHMVLPDSENLTGEYVGAPQWGDGTYMLDSESFAFWQDYTTQLIGGNGYQWAFVLGGPANGQVRLRELIRRMSNSGGCRFPWVNGQLRLVMLDDAATTDGLPEITEPAKLRMLPTPSFADEEVENPQFGTYDWDDDKQRWRVAQEEFRDDIAIARMGRPKPSPSPVEMRCVRDPVTARDVMQRRLLRRKYPPEYVPVTEALAGLDRNPGDVVLVDSQEGTGEGYDFAPMFIRETTYDQRTRRVTHVCRNLSQILAGVALASPDDLEDYDSATAEERALYAFAADDDGTVDDGAVVGKEAR